MWKPTRDGEGGINLLNKLRDEIHQNAIDHGWWEEERSFGDIIALCHSELSEALEEYRNSNDRVRKNPIYYSGGGYICDQPSACSKKPEGIAIELADCIIRILDYCGKEGIDIEEAISIKHEYNKTRPYKHGGKVI
jgi:NTP pyrophosphatase (non-canonical NTP hydrolase)